MSILISAFTFILIIVAILLVLVVLAQKTKDGGMGAALGGGMTESTFGAETGNVLSKATINLSIALFVLSFGLYLGHIHMRKAARNSADGALPTIAAPAAPSGTAPASSPAPVTVPSSTPESKPAETPKAP